MKPFSYGQLMDWHKCQKYFYFKRVMGLSDGVELSGDVAFGSCLHLGIQDLFEGGDGVDMFTSYWGFQEEKNLEYSRYKHTDLLPLGQQLVEIFRDEHQKKFTPASCPKTGEPLIERRLEGRIGSHPFCGVVDLVGGFAGLLSAVDWKTAAYPYDAYKIVCNEQLYGYVELAKQDLGLAIEQVVYGVAVKDPKNPRWQFRKSAVTPEKLTIMLGNLEKACDAISSTTHFIRNPGQCVVGKRICPFFQRCHGAGAHGGQGGGDKEGTEP